MADDGMADETLGAHYDVFRSYRREEDAARAVLCDALEAEGYSVFWDGRQGKGERSGELRNEVAALRAEFRLNPPAGGDAS